MRKIALDTDEIVRLHAEEGLRAGQIAEQLGCGEEVVYERLERAGVPRSRKARLPMEQVKHLYTVDGWSTKEIGARFGVSRTTVSSHLRAAGVQVRRNVPGRQLTGRRPCPNSVVFRAYALGLVWGDFSAERQGPGSVTIRVRSSTTRAEQVQLARDVFEAFGPVKYRGRSLYISLDLSFSFLREKYRDSVPSWIRGSEASAAFVAGYVDAEGSFGVYEGRARCKIDAYDEAVLRWLHAWCRRTGVRSRFRRVARRGDPRGAQPPFRDDLWRVNVNDGLSLLRFIATIDPYLKHIQRRADAEVARQNILNRLRSRIGDQQIPLLCASQPRRSWEVDTRRPHPRAVRGGRPPGDAGAVPGHDGPRA